MACVWPSGGRDPSDQILATFASCFSTEASLYECREGPMHIAPTLVQIRSLVSITDHGQIATQILLVEEHILEYMQACLARFGLMLWCPDLHQTPYALYNVACRVIALDTFKQALVSHTYAHLKLNMTYAWEMEWLIHLYDHHYMYLQYQRDSRNPGCVTAADKASPRYRGCARVCASSPASVQ